MLSFEVSLKAHSLGPIQILANASRLKMMKNPVYFMSKALFIL